MADPPQIRNGVHDNAMMGTTNAQLDPSTVEVLLTRPTAMDQLFVQVLRNRWVQIVLTPATVWFNAH